MYGHVLLVWWPSLGSENDKCFTKCETLVRVGSRFWSPPPAMNSRWPGTRGTSRKPFALQPASSSSWCFLKPPPLELVWTTDSIHLTIPSSLRIPSYREKVPSDLYSLMVGKASMPLSRQTPWKSTQFILIGITCLSLPSRSAKVRPCTLSAICFHMGANFWQWTHHPAKKLIRVKSWNWTTCSKLWCLKPSWESAQSESSSSSPSDLARASAVLLCSSSPSSSESAPVFVEWWPACRPSLPRVLSLYSLSRDLIVLLSSSSMTTTLRFLHSMSYMSMSKLICSCELSKWSSNNAVDIFMSRKDQSSQVKSDSIKAYATRVQMPPVTVVSTNSRGSHLAEREAGSIPARPSAAQWPPRLPRHPAGA
mmetsp:Transcript_11155/g.25416  ORF Transcript_11155/g.25416 Transcript_11155/m.25416 type:complete len:366 (-) Transcript_11155:8-1105(-)